MSTSTNSFQHTHQVATIAGSALLLCAAMLSGCATTPELTHSGFLSDYSKLSAVDGSRMRFESPTSDQYHSFILVPVQVMVSGGVLNPEERAEVARYFLDQFERAFADTGFRVTDEPGVGVAQVRLALTDVAESTWWKKIHPVSRAVGAGTGGAAMEAEVVDSVTGEQIAAVIQAGKGNQFNLTNFSTLADVKSAIGSWARIAADRLRELNAGA